MESIKRNLFYQIAYQIITMVLPLITAPYISRVIGTSGVGLYSYTYSIVSYFVLFARLGINVYGIRAIASVKTDQQKLNKTFTELLCVHILTSFIAMAVYSIYIYCCTPEYRIIALIQSMIVIGELLEVNWLFFGLEKFNITVSRNIIISIISLVAMFIFVRTPEDTWKYCAILAGCGLASESVMWVWVPQYVKLEKIAVKDALKHFKPLISFFIPAIAVSLYKVMDKIMLGFLAGEIQVGLYESSEKIITISLSLISTLGVVMLPRMTALVVQGNREMGDKMLYLSMKVIMIGTMAISFGIMGVASVFAPVFYGNEFIDCAPLMIGLTISLPFTAFADVLRTQYLLPNNRDKVYQVSLVTGAIVNIAINFVLIPRLHAMGAVIGTIMAEAVVCIIQSVNASSDLPIRKYVKMSLPYLLMGGIMGVLVYGVGYRMKAGINTLLLQILAGVLLYMVLAVIYLRKTKDELWDIVVGFIHKK